MILDAQALHRFVLHRMHFLVLERLRDLDRVCSQQLVHDPLAHLGPHLLVGLVAHVIDDVRLELLQTALLDVEHFGQLVIHRRQSLLLDAVRVDRELDFLPLQIFGVVVLRELDLEGLLVAGLDAGEAFFEVRQHLALAENHRHFLTLAALDRLAPEFAVEVDDNAVARRARAVHLGPGRFLLSQIIDHVIDVTVRDLDLRLFDLDLVEPVEFDLGHDFKRRHVTEALAVSPGFRLDLRPARRIQVLLLHGVGVALLHQV